MQPPNLQETLAKALSHEMGTMVPEHLLPGWVNVHLVPELMTESRLFYGNGEDTALERRNPGFDYTSQEHRSWLKNYPHHMHFFAALDRCRFTDRDVHEVCDWRGTLAHRRAVERDAGMIIRDTLWDEVSVHVRPPGSPYAEHLSTETTPPAEPTAPAGARGALPRGRPRVPQPRVRWRHRADEIPTWPEHGPDGPPLGPFGPRSAHHVCPPRRHPPGSGRQFSPESPGLPPRPLSHAHPSSAWLREQASESVASEGVASGGADENEDPNSPATVVHNPGPHSPSQESLAMRGGHLELPSFAALSTFSSLDVEPDDDDDDEETGVELVARSVGTRLQRRLLAASEAEAGCEVVGAIAPLWARWMKEAMEPDQDDRASGRLRDRMGTLEHIADLQRRMSGVSLDLPMSALAASSGAL